MPLEPPAPPSLQILAIARYRCGLRLVWHENPSLLFVPPRMKHYTSQRDLPELRQHPAEDPIAIDQQVLECRQHMQRDQRSEHDGDGLMKIHEQIAPLLVFPGPGRQSQAEELDAILIEGR